jgi:SAM-dependent methyltransferase
MAESRLPRPARPAAESRLRARPSETYRYRANGVGRDAPSRLNTIDLDLLGLRPGDRVLDVGCGTGRHVIEALGRDCYVVGVDCDRAELRRLQVYGFCLAAEGRMRGKGAAVLGDGLRLPFADAAFDRVICTEVLEHVTDDRLLMGELSRLVRPGGTLAVSVPDRAAEVICWRIASLRGRRPGEHVRVYRREALAGLLRSCGFAVYARRYRHSLESLYWFLLVGAENGSVRRLSAAWRRFLDEKTAEGSHLLGRIEGMGNFILPKSFVLYARKAGQGRAP